MVDIRVPREEAAEGFEKQVERVGEVAEGLSLHIPEPAFRIMYWKEADGSLDFSEGWFYIHDQETGDPIECDSLREVEKALIAAMNKGYKPINLKVVKEYPVKLHVELKYE